MITSFPVVLLTDKHFSIQFNSYSYSQLNEYIFKAKTWTIHTIPSMRLKSQFQRRLRILLPFKQFMRLLFTNVVSTGKSMHKGVRRFTQDFKKSLFNLEKSSITVCRKAYHRERTDPSSALIFYKILARFYWLCKKKKKKKSLQLSSQIYLLTTSPQY